MIENVKEAEATLDAVERALDSKVVIPDLDLQQAVGRVSAAANEMWHKIAAMRAEEWSHRNNKETA